MLGERIKFSRKDLISPKAMICSDFTQDRQECARARAPALASSNQTHWTWTMRACTKCFCSMADANAALWMAHPCLCLITSCHSAPLASLNLPLLLSLRASILLATWLLIKFTSAMQKNECLEITWTNLTGYYQAHQPIPGCQSFFVTDSGQPILH